MRQMGRSSSTACRIARSVASITPSHASTASITPAGFLGFRGQGSVASITPSHASTAIITPTRVRDKGPGRIQGFLDSRLALDPSLTVCEPERRRELVVEADVSGAVDDVEQVALAAAALHHLGGGGGGRGGSA